MYRREVCGTPRVELPRNIEFSMLLTVVDTCRCASFRLCLVFCRQEGEDDDPTTRRGFDSLRNNGMTRGEVTAIRGYFSSQVREVSASFPPPLTLSLLRQESHLVQFSRNSLVEEDRHLLHVTSMGRSCTQAAEALLYRDCPMTGHGAATCTSWSRLGNLYVPPRFLAPLRSTNNFGSTRLLLPQCKKTKRE